MITKFGAHEWGFIVFIFSALSLCMFMLAIGFLLGGRSQGRSKNVPFESGINSVSISRLHFSAKFYLVAMFFVIFDIEALYLYTWAIVVRETAWIGFIEVNIFILTLLIGLFYLVRMKALEWTPKRLYYSQRNNLIISSHTIKYKKK